LFKLGKVIYRDDVSFTAGNPPQFIHVHRFGHTHSHHSCDALRLLGHGDEQVLLLVGLSICDNHHHVHHIGSVTIDESEDAISGLT
jgi:hypothetical protein